MWNESFSSFPWKIEMAINAHQVNLSATTSSGTTWNCIGPATLTINFHKPHSFEDEFIAVDKIANYRPQQNSLGSKLVSVRVERAGKDEEAVCDSPVIVSEEEEGTELCSYSMTWAWDMDTCRDGSHSVMLRCSLGYKKDSRTIGDVVL